METSGQSQIRGAVFNRLSARFFQTVSLAAALFSLASAQADTLVTPPSSNGEVGQAGTSRNLPQAGQLEISGLSSGQAGGTFRDWPAISLQRAATEAQLSSLLNVPGPLSAPFTSKIGTAALAQISTLTLETDAVSLVADFNTPDLLSGGEVSASDALASLLGPSYAGTAKSKNAISITQFTRVPEPSIVILSGVGLAVALFGRKRAGRAPSRR